MSSGRRLARVDVADDNDVDMSLLLTHDEGCVMNEVLKGWKLVRSKLKLSRW
jgi:hypothetical protein